MMWKTYDKKTNDDDGDAFPRQVNWSRWSRRSTCSFKDLACPWSTTTRRTRCPSWASPGIAPTSVTLHACITTSSPHTPANHFHHCIHLYYHLCQPIYLWPVLSPIHLCYHFCHPTHLWLIWSLHTPVNTVLLHEPVNHLNSVSVTKYLSVTPYTCKSLPYACIIAITQYTCITTSVTPPTHTHTLA